MADAPPFIPEPNKYNSNISEVRKIPLDVSQLMSGQNLYLTMRCEIGLEQKYEKKTQKSKEKLAKKPSAANILKPPLILHNPLTNPTLLRSNKDEIVATIVIEGVVAQAILDTGATTSFIRKEFFKKLPQKVKGERVHVTAILANGSRHRVKWSTNLKVTLGKLTTTVQFLISSHVVDDVLLGYNFLRGCQATLNCAGFTVSFENGTESNLTIKCGGEQENDQHPQNGQVSTNTLTETNHSANTPKHNSSFKHSTQQGRYELLRDFEQTNYEILLNSPTMIPTELGNDQHPQFQVLKSKDIQTNANHIIIGSHLNSCINPQVQQGYSPYQHLQVLESNTTQDNISYTAKAPLHIFPELWQVQQINYLQQLQKQESEQTQFLANHIGIESLYNCPLETSSQLGYIQHLPFHVLESKDTQLKANHRAQEFQHNSLINPLFQQYQPHQMLEFKTSQAKAYHTAREPLLNFLEIRPAQQVNYEQLLLPNRKFEETYNGLLFNSPIKPPVPLMSNVQQLPFQNLDIKSTCLESNHIGIESLQNMYVKPPDQLEMSQHQVWESTETYSILNQLAKESPLNTHINPSDQQGNCEQLKIKELLSDALCKVNHITNGTQRHNSHVNLPLKQDNDEPPAIDSCSKSSHKWPTFRFEGISKADSDAMSPVITKWVDGWKPGVFLQIIKYYQDKRFRIIITKTGRGRIIALGKRTQIG